MKKRFKIVEPEDEAIEVQDPEDGLVIASIYGATPDFVKFLENAEDADKDDPLTFDEVNELTEAIASEIIYRENFKHRANFKTELFQVDRAFFSQLQAFAEKCKAARKKS